MAAAERSTPPTPPRRPSVAAPPHVQFVAFHRWIVGYWLTRWLDGLPQPGMQLDGYPRAWHPCGGGSYPPCWRVGTESATAGLYRAYNPTGCSGTGCYGKWQFGGFWAGRLGLPIDIAHATPGQQDEAARLLWNGGAGCANWAAC